MQSHEFGEKDDKQRQFCRHCGCLWHAQLDASCINRLDSTATPRPIEHAMDDLATIRSRIEELKKEREAMAARTDAT